MSGLDEAEARAELAVGGSVERAAVFALLALGQELNGCTVAMLERLEDITTSLRRLEVELSRIGVRL